MSACSWMEHLVSVVVFCVCRSGYGQHNLTWISTSRPTHRAGQLPNVHTGWNGSWWVSFATDKTENKNMLMLHNCLRCYFFLNAQYKNNAMEFIFTFKCIKNKCNHYDSALWEPSLCHVPIFQSIVGQTTKQIVPPNIMLLVESLARFPLQIWAKLLRIF